MHIDPQTLFPFKLDDYQLEAIVHLDDGKSVVVCAPTGSGKTVIGEYAVELAIRNQRRCFYTTPLKALSNQKFHDLRRKYGEDGVGLLTGDISVNREAPVVVMTTEVFRNMLYGTSLGDVNKNLRDVAFVILDECHYMNDAERGTVWEESIIYSPADIQLVALSATIANAAELTSWIGETHGPTELVLSTYRPVPLRFYYFGGRRLMPLFSPGGAVNSQVMALSGAKKRRPGFAHRGRRADVPQPGDVLVQLSARNMLPAIYFVFSRRGCEESMRNVRGIALLNEHETADLAEAIAGHIKDNPNLAHHPHLPYLYEGVCVHHAGMLPSWKSLVERLFVRGLLKCVFATETLAAGINMPARTTVISAVSKRSDDGHRTLTASEFLQMSGRAGRRGMDEVGHVVVLQHPFEDPADVAVLAKRPSDPLTSRFTPGYGMVLNLLQRHSLEEARDLIERSFGQYVVSRELEPAYLEKMQAEQELARLTSPLCPKEPGDLDQYKRQLEQHHARAKQAKMIQRGMASQRGDEARRGQAVIESLRREMQGFLAAAHAMPCNGCPVQKACAKQTARQRNLAARVKELGRRINTETTRHWRTFVALADILRVQGYLDGNKPTKLGEMAAAIRGTNELFLAEVVVTKLLFDLSPVECASVLTSLISEDSRAEEAAYVPVSPTVDMVLLRVKKLARRFFQLQRDFSIDVPIEFSPIFSGLSQMWAEGAEWEQIRLVTSFDEGDLVRALRRTVDLARQFARASNVNEHVADLCLRCEALLARDEVREDF